MNKCTSCGNMTQVTLLTNLQVFNVSRQVELNLFCMSIRDKAHKTFQKKVFSAVLHSVFNEEMFSSSDKTTVTAASMVQPPSVDKFAVVASCCVTTNRVSFTSRNTDWCHNTVCTWIRLHKEAFSKGIWENSDLKLQCFSCPARLTSSYSARSSTFSFMRSLWAITNETVSDDKIPRYHGALEL